METIIRNILNRDVQYDKVEAEYGIETVCELKRFVNYFSSMELKLTDPCCVFCMGRVVDPQKISIGKGMIATRIGFGETYYSRPQENSVVCKKCLQEFNDLEKDKCEICKKSSFFHLEDGTCFNCDAEDYGMILCKGCYTVMDPNQERCSICNLKKGGYPKK